MPLVVDINGIDRVAVPLTRNFDVEIAGVRHNRRARGGYSVPLEKHFEQGAQAVAPG